jgi:ectoine hydroxylase-related dioxygenase (phytanoyl-CoA dioxygenase family)
VKNAPNRPPDKAYGVIQQDATSSDIDEAVEQVRRLGYAILDSGYGPQELEEISEAFNAARTRYVREWGEERLKALDEFHTIRALLTQGHPVFRRLAMNRHLIAALQRLIVGKFVLNQQNGIINPPGETYNQAAWHRDLPYQHYVSSTPLAINALYCVDDFTRENGSTFVLPASHKVPAFPTQKYIERNALQVEARAGQYILLDCMMFHSGGRNESARSRRAVNHVYNIPYFKQQINLPGNLDCEDLSEEEKSIMGFHYQEPVSVDAYLASRAPKQRS